MSRRKQIIENVRAAKRQYDALSGEEKARIDYIMVGPHEPTLIDVPYLFKREQKT